MGRRRHLDDYARAFWATGTAGGDVDTTCAIVGGILGARSAPPPEWLEHCEPLPAWALTGEDAIPPRCTPAAPAAGTSAQGKGGADAPGRAP
ncbi:ADP-ribosylglycohydrolase family protein [Spongiactinospora gelatinilytica]|uniref:ADP-ribosylglycohydrolase family protein n=1 Tax=Spongiactinospora gelatinilytica TaxID=2666298 RepID=UPI0027BA42E1|nr:ADP-ribosylglycohydrolase family protein [Spongiactinospora gelatinilytica]